MYRVICLAFVVLFACAPTAREFEEEFTDGGIRFDGSVLPTPWFCTAECDIDFELSPTIWCKASAVCATDYDDVYYLANLEGQLGPCLFEGACAGVNDDAFGQMQLRFEEWLHGYCLYKDGTWEYGAGVSTDRFGCTIGSRPGSPIVDLRGILTPPPPLRGSLLFEGSCNTDTDDYQGFAGCLITW